MATDPCWTVLNRVADKLSEGDLKSIKFLVSDIDGISRQWLESASAKKIILALKERKYDDFISILAELLHAIGRRDLYEEVTVFADREASCTLSVHKVRMCHIAQSMSKDDRRNARFRLDVEARDESYDGIELMALIESRTPVADEDQLRQAMDELELSYIYDEAVRAGRGRRDGVTRPPRAVLRTSSFCDGTGCNDDCVYRQLWTEKFPHQSSPVFRSERLLNHDDLSTDGEELLCEGRFGNIYRGQ